MSFKINIKFWMTRETVVTLLRRSVTNLTVRKNCCYGHITLMPTSNDVLIQQDIQRYTCKTCQNNYIDKNEFVQHRKREHPSNIVVKYFLTNTCRRSSNQGALSCFRHDQLPLCVPNVAKAAQGVAKSVAIWWNKKIPLFPAIIGGGG